MSFQKYTIHGNSIPLDQQGPLDTNTYFVPVLVCKQSYQNLISITHFYRDITIDLVYVVSSKLCYIGRHSRESIIGVPW